jgi:methylated-DNA-protein-cysteine methyltransferase related protein
MLRTHDSTLSKLGFKGFKPDSRRLALTERSRYEQIYQVVRQIPPGKVATYGQVAALAGIPRHARQVGYALFRVAPGSDIPWQRVVNAQGKISYSPFREGNDDFQQQLLIDEGITFDQDGKINLRQYQWQPSQLEPGICNLD